MSKTAAAGLLSLVVSAAAYAAEPPVRDPTQPFGRTAAGVPARAAEPRFKLTAVLIAPTRRVAILNGKPYVMGEAVDGAEIVAIEHDTVRLRERGTDVVISLGRP